MDATGAINRIGVVVHPHRALDRALASLQAWTAAHGADVVQIPIHRQERVVAPAGEAASCDLVVALGGDGTMLADGTEAIVVTPVAAHGGSTPPLVVAATSTVTIEIEGGFGGARIESDGQLIELEPRVLRTSWCADYATLVRFDGAETAFAGLRRRRILMDSPRVVARDERAAAGGVAACGTDAGAPSADAVDGAQRGSSASRE